MLCLLNSSYDNSSYDANRQKSFHRVFIFLSQDLGEKGPLSEEQMGNRPRVSMTFATIDAHLGYGIRYVGFIAPFVDFDL